jgi:hypothetical protein
MAIDVQVLRLLRVETTDAPAFDPFINLSIEALDDCPMHQRECSDPMIEWMETTS